MSRRAFRYWALLTPARNLEGLVLLVVRASTAAFLVHGVWDNIADRERMTEFITFMQANGFVAAEFWAPFSVYTQFLAGGLLLAGLLTRWAGLFIAATFAIALWVVHWEQDLRGWWPALSLVLIGLILATRGAGPLSIDAILGRGRRPPPHFPAN